MSSGNVRLYHAYVTSFNRTLRLLFRVRFKYDVFISYRRSEASTYAQSLRDRLKELGYRCFLDLEELPPGHRLSDSLKNAIRKSRTFVLLGSRTALESEYVRLEVEEFAATGRLLLPIDIGESIARFPNNPIVDRDLVRITETHDQFETGVPALRVTDEIDRAFRGIRVRTQRLIEAASLALAVLAVVVTIAYVLNNRVARSQALLGEVERDLATSRKELATTQTELKKSEDAKALVDSQAASRSLLLRAQDAADKHDVDRAIALALEAVETDPSSDDGVSTLASLAYAPGTRRVFTLDNTSAVSSLALSADGSRALLGKPDGTVILWDTATLRLIRLLKKHAQDVKSLAFSPDGRLAVSGSFDGSVVLWSVPDGNVLHEWRSTVRAAHPGSNAILGLVVTPDGHTVFSISRNDSVCRHDVHTGERLCHRWPDTGNGMHAIAIAPAGDVAVVGTWSRKIGSVLILWNAGDFSEIRRWAVDGAVRNAAFAESGHAVAVSHVGRLTSFNREGRATNTWDYDVNDWAISPDGKRTLGASSNGSLIELDLWTGKTREFWGHLAEVTKVVYGPGGVTAFSASRDGFLRLWDLTSGNVIHRLPGTSPVALNRSKSVVASSLGAWSLENGAQLGKRWSTEECTAGYYSSAVRAIAFSPNESQLLSGWFMYGQGGSARRDLGICSLILLDFQTGSPIKKLAAGREVRAVAFLPSGNELLSAAFDSLITSNIKTEKSTWRKIGAFSSFAFSDDGRLYAMGSSDGTVRIGATEKDGSITTFAGQGAAASALAFSQDGRLVLCGFENGEIHLFDMNSGARTGTWRGHAGPVRGVAIGERGRLGLSGSEDGTVRLANLHRAGAGRIVAVHQGTVGAVAFGAGDRTSVSASDDGIIVAAIGAREELIHWTKANRYMRK